jgi:hypothetical protein
MERDDRDALRVTRFLPVHTVELAGTDKTAASCLYGCIKFKHAVPLFTASSPIAV